MEPVDEVKQKLHRALSVLRREYPIKNLGLFGSYGRGEATKSSDLDILIEFERPISLLRFVALERRLSDLLGVKVDLVMKSALKPHIGKRILEEVIPV